VALPPTYTSSPPRGGLRLRLRAPAAYAGKLKSVRVGGKAWAGIDAEAETVDFSAEALKSWAPGSGENIVATFG
jgi:hypothetical protein